MKNKRQTNLLIIGLLVSILLVDGPASATALDLPFSMGPFVDAVVYKVIGSQDQRIYALQDGEIELCVSSIDPILYLLMDDPDIGIYQAVRNGYTHLTFNCAKYPLNISGLRRAVAFAFNQNAVIIDEFNGFGINHDSLVPNTSSWCIENEFQDHYYTAEPAIGNAILDDLGFAINASSGYRLAPNGSSFEISIEYPASGINPFINHIVAAFDSLHINARGTSSDFNNYVERLENHGDYDAVLLGTRYYDDDIRWLADDYSSKYIDTYGKNPCNFENATFDSLLDQFLNGSDYEDVFAAVSEMQKILHYNVPRFVIEERIDLYPYRTDRFEGHVFDILEQISGQWTMRKIRRTDGIFGGTVPVAIDQDVDTFNIYTTNSRVTNLILDNLYPSLFKMGPDYTPLPDICENMLVETHMDNPAVSDGHTRFTIDLIQNATWSDGVPLTAEDVAFSIIYALESAPYGNPASTDLGHLASVYAPTQYQTVIEFNTESYWHFNSFAYDYIIPEHIFNNETGIGYQGWNTWNPVFDPDAPNVNCGPFIFSDYEEGEFYELTPNRLFHYTLQIPAEIITTNVTTTSTTNGTSAIPEPYPFTFVSMAISVASSTVIIVSLIRIFQYRKNSGRA